MADKRCRQCVEAAKPRGHQYPIWDDQCDACCKRVLAYYPEGHLSGAMMAIVVARKRGFGFVRLLQRELRDEALAREAQALRAA